MKNWKYIFSGLAILSGLALTAVGVLAAGSVDVGLANSNIVLSANSPINTATAIINVILSLLSLAALVIIIWGGFIWMTSNGNGEKIDQAKKILKNGIIGLVIILSAWGITYFILTKLLGATGNGGSSGNGSCSDGTTSSCGCGGAQTCNSGTWGPCLNSTCNPSSGQTVNCDGNAILGGCQASDTICGTGYYCDSSSCTCKAQASLGESCNVSKQAGVCSANDSLCGPYLKCSSTSCLCEGSPVITGVSPTGGFCSNNSNTACNKDSDCGVGTTCNLTTPNGAANNLLTIYGYNFGNVSNFYQNVLTNVDFEQISANGLPTNWTEASQAASKVAISTADYHSGKQSVLLHQDLNQNYPGICNQAACTSQIGCTWNAAAKTCSFKGVDQCHLNSNAVYNFNESLCWPNTNRVMWEKLTYDISSLSFQPGEKYTINFYYKGKTAGNVQVALAPNLGWSTQCVWQGSAGVLKSGYTWQNGQVSPAPTAGNDPCNNGYGQTCSAQSGYCCVQAPVQTKCYNPSYLPSINAGTYGDWTLYSYTFIYTPEMTTWLDKNGHKIIEVGMSIGYNNTGAGTDFYVDDFTMTKVNPNGEVVFLGTGTATTTNSTSLYANFPTILNPNCISSWTDRQIVVAVPNGTINGPIKVKREVSSSDPTIADYDTTNNSVGPKISNFVANDIIRPGLCAITPTSGLLGDKVVYQGVNLSSSSAYFGNYVSPYSGINSSFATNQTGSTLAPSITAGLTTTFVGKAVAGIKEQSNVLQFVKEPDPNIGPFISSFSPANGPDNQYVTINGQGFGNVRGSQKVYFGDTEAAYDFPDVCTQSVWSDNQIVVKVPANLANGNYLIKLALTSGIINSGLLSQSNFTVDSTQLKPSLCKIDPIRGQTGDAVKLWGEYFGNSGVSDLVTFYNNQATSSLVVKETGSNVNADRLDVNVPTAAITGPINVTRNSNTGNSLNFAIGACSADSDCGSGQVCCVSGTYKAGRCAATAVGCYYDIPHSVYEASFNTGLGNNPSVTSSNNNSCSGLAAYYGTCLTNQFCPNSPGKCSPYAGGNPVVGSTCGGKTNQCDNLVSCQGGGCTYDSGKDVCYTTNSTCSLSNIFSYKLDANSATSSVLETCAPYNNKFYYQIKVSGSCPLNWTSIGNNICINKTTVCSSCSVGLSCIDNGSGVGRCESSKICSSDATCQLSGSAYACVSQDKSTCDCCCRKAEANADCCAPLICAGTCGSDTIGTNYGLCSGCAAAIPANPSETATQAHDAACNCATANGKFCQVDSSHSTGACVDCANLDAAGCKQHSNVCCYDSANKSCIGGNGTTLSNDPTNPLYGSCAFYDCNVTNKTTCNQTPTTTGQFLATSTCVSVCPKNPQTVCDLVTSQTPAACSVLSGCCFNAKTNKCTDGIEKLAINGTNYCSFYNCSTGNTSCNVNSASTTGTYLGLAGCLSSCAISEPGASCQDTATTCNKSICGTPYFCLASTTGATSLSDCGVCCCAPGTANSAGLKCVPNVGNCSGSSRGLFCGCKADSDCGDLNNQGCSSDSCCYGRPHVASTMPANQATNVCRNSLLEVIFNKTMTTDNFASNILLLEENKPGAVCQSGTLLSSNTLAVNQPTLLARLWGQLSSIWQHLFGYSNSALAAAKPDNSKVYCTVPIAITTSIAVSSNGTSETLADIAPQRLLSPNDNYFLVVKGDPNLSSNLGVLSLNKVGLSGSNSPIIPTTTATFNGLLFTNSYIFGFTTKDENMTDKGICAVDHVATAPVSVLINSATNDVAENDLDANDPTFDTKNDRDHALSAYAYSIDGQKLVPTTGYSWTYNWSVDNPAVAYVQTQPPVNNLPNNRVLVVGATGVTDSETQVKATISMSPGNVYNIGNGLFGTTDLYVFICNNPWPATSANGLWSPWQDYKTSNTSNYNYKFYYCRDAGGPGTADDLPAISNPAVILGSSGNLVCSLGGATCKNAGDSCGPDNNGDGIDDGFCVWSVLKESYFFRDAIPQTGSITAVSSLPTGNGVNISWYSPQTNVSSYNVYYGASTGGALLTKTISAADHSACSTSAGNYNCATTITGLNNGQQYYFKVSSLSATKAESVVSGIQYATVTDTVAPAVPAGLMFSQSGPKLIFSWNKNINDAIYYRLYHGLAPNQPGESFDSANNATSLALDITIFRPGIHYLSLSALDKSGNESARSQEVKLIIPSVPAGLTASQNNNQVNVSWDSIPEETAYYFLYKDVNSILNIFATSSVTNLSFALGTLPAGNNYFSVAALSATGILGAPSADITIVGTTTPNIN